MTYLNDSINPAADPKDFLHQDLTPEFKYHANGVENGFEGVPDEMPLVPVPVTELEESYASMS